MSSSVVASTWSCIARISGYRVALRSGPPTRCDLACSLCGRGHVYPHSVERRALGPRRRDHHPVRATAASVSTSHNPTACARFAGDSDLIVRIVSDWA
jgi:hypothetical protein